jgi:hypothetical protein
MFPGQGPYFTMVKIGETAAAIMTGKASRSDLPYMI